VAEANKDGPFFVRPPQNFYEMSEEEQLAWTRQVGEQLKSAARREQTTQDEPEDDA
jgi:hypothetical protein